MKALDCGEETRFAAQAGSLLSKPPTFTKSNNKSPNLLAEDVQAFCNTYSTFITYALMS